MKSSERNMAKRSLKPDNLHPNVCCCKGERVLRTVTSTTEGEREHDMMLFAFNKVKKQVKKLIVIR